MIGGAILLPDPISWSDSITLVVEDREDLVVQNLAVLNAMKVARNPNGRAGQGHLYKQCGASWPWQDSCSLKHNKLMDPEPLALMPTSTFFLVTVYIQKDILFIREANDCSWIYS